MDRDDRLESERAGVATKTVRLHRRRRQAEEELREAYREMGPLNQELAEEAIFDHEIEKYESRLAEAD